MEWIIYLLVGILVAYVHFKILDFKWMWEIALIALFWPVVLVLDVLVVFI